MILLDTIKIIQNTKHNIWYDYQTFWGSLVGAAISMLVMWITLKVQSKNDRKNTFDSEEYLEKYKILNDILKINVNIEEDFRDMYMKYGCFFSNSINKKSSQTSKNAFISISNAKNDFMNSIKLINDYEILSHKSHVMCDVFEFNKYRGTFIAFHDNYEPLDKITEQIYFEIVDVKQRLQNFMKLKKVSNYDFDQFMQNLRFVQESADNIVINKTAFHKQLKHTTML